MRENPLLWLQRVWWSLSLGRALLVVSCSAGLLFVFTRPTTGMYVRDWEREINEQLPFESSHELVEAWIANHQLNSWAARDASHRVREIETVIPNRSLLFTSACIEIEFLFDVQERLIKSTIVWMA
jgi:hypothetical protein